MTGITRIIYLVFAGSLVLTACQTVSAEQTPKNTPAPTVRPDIVGPTSTPIPSPQSNSPLTTPINPSGNLTITGPTATIACPRIILFYGDSRMGGLGQSFVDDIQDRIGPCYKLVLADYWGRTAEWGWANFTEKVLAREPDDVVLWWGGNDFGGCLQTTNFKTDLPDETKFHAALESYLSALQSQIDTLSRLGKGVYVMTEPRVNGGLLPWAVIDSKGNTTYDHNHLCSYDWVSDAMAEAQRQLVAKANAQGQNVVLLDAWKLFMDNQTVEGMYSTDVVHAGIVGRQKLAELFLEKYRP